jgi:signal transduction histidine kinase/DNA-binding response OmpR family regulator
MPKAVADKKIEFIINAAAGQPTGMTSSTRRYPEWPLARLSHTPDKLSAKVAQALFLMKESAPAAKSAKIAGWAYPLSYQPVHDCLKELQPGPYEPKARKNQKWFIFGGIAFIAVCLGAFGVAKLNARLSTINGHLIREVEKRKKIEAGLIESEKQLKETQFNLESALAAANEANRSKDEFLANMSHELRTPMNGIIGITGILQNSELTDEQSEYTDIIMKSSEGLLAIITDILDFSQIEAGTTKLDTIGFDLTALINEVSKTIEPKAKEKHLALYHRVDADVPVYLKGAPRHLKKVIRNLMGNAVKFTHQGTVSLHVNLAQDEEHHCILRFVVKDTGIGIDPGRKDRIFDPFSQIDYSSTRRYNGTGLGLALAKHFTEMMGGHIGFESRPNQGSTFWFTIRLEKEKSLPIQKPYHSDDITGKRILVVDDNPTNRQVLAGYLRSWRLPYDTAESAREALAAMQRAVSEKDPFELAVIDHMMPEMDGVDLGRAIKQDPLLKDVGMVLFTSIGIGCDTDEISSAGFDAFLAKPVRASQLLNCLKLVCGQNESPQHSHFQSDRLITHEILNEAKASGPRILVVEDNVINQKVMLKILGVHGCHAEVAENGRLAVQELCRNDYDVVLMDVQMPEMNGYEATGAIRNPGNRCLNPTVPIIAVTANTMKEDRKRCLDAGMDDYLPKPVDPNILMKKIRQWHEKPQIAGVADMNVSN